MNKDYPDLTTWATINYSRNKEKFIHPRMWDYVKVDKSLGYYVQASNHDRVTFDVMGRVVADVPDGFRFMSFQTSRYAFTYTGDNWSTACQQAMTHRSIAAFKVITDPSNWPCHHVDAIKLGFDCYCGTTTQPHLKNLLFRLGIDVQTDSMGIAELQYLSISINPTTARNITYTQEIRAYLAQPRDREDPRNNLNRDHPNFYHGLPECIYGFPLHIHTEIIMKNGASRYAFPDNVMLMSTKLPPKKEVIDGREVEVPTKLGDVSFNTLSMYYLTEMQVAEDSQGKYVTTDMAFGVSCPLSGFLVDLQPRPETFAVSTPPKPTLPKELMGDDPQPYIVQ